MVTTALKAKHFAWLFLGVYAVLASVILISAAWLQPFEGDLTRIGARAENNFGWRVGQKRFEENLGAYYQSSGEHYTGKQAIVVFGDSFSHMGVDDERRFGWQNFFVAASGQSIYTYHVGDVDIETWLREQKPKHLPKLIIYQQVERGFANIRHDTESCAEVTTFENAPSHSLRLERPLDVPTSIYWRKSKALFEFSSALHWLKLKSHATSRAREFPLRRADLFSNRLSQKLLVYENDFLLERAQGFEPAVVEIRCYLHTLRQLANAKGVEFLAVMVPDKYSVYRNFASGADASEDLYALLNTAGVVLPPLDQRFQEAVHEGATDLYLPNDTHWGSSGNALFANLLLELLAQSNE